MAFDKDMLKMMFDMLTPILIERLTEPPATTETRVVLYQYGKQDPGNFRGDLFVDVPNELEGGWKLCNVRHDTRAVSALYHRETRRKTRVEGEMDAEFVDESVAASDDGTRARCVSCNATFVVELPGQDRCGGCLLKETDPREDASQDPG